MNRKGSIAEPFVFSSSCDFRAGRNMALSSEGDKCKGSSTRDGPLSLPVMSAHAQNVWRLIPVLCSNWHERLCELFSGYVRKRTEGLVTQGDSRDYDARGENSGAVGRNPQPQ